MVFKKGNKLWDNSNSKKNQFKKGDSRLVGNSYGFKKGDKPICPFKKGHKLRVGLHPKTEFKKGHKKIKNSHSWKKGDTAGEKNAMYGTHYSEESKENLRLKNKGKHFSIKTEFKKGIHPETEFKLGNKIRLGSNHNGLSRIKQSAKKQGIDIKDWTKFVSREPYSQEWNNLFKRAIRKRDNQICMLCGIHREKLNRALDVHHINYNKLMSIPQNCVSLCKSCHSKTISNRPYWTKFFQSLLFEKYGYKYDNNNVIILEVND